MLKGLVADIQRASVHDGPGIRTTVFFKGCPLNCAWCHNPECISFLPQELFYKERCIGCNKCNEGCYADARVICGKEMTAQEIVQIVLQDLPYYKQTGGVTISGGEPFAQKEFLIELLQILKQNKINTAIETTMYIFDKEILSMVDTIMVDIKIFDNALHKKYVGADNTNILKNIKKADELGIPMIIRTPIITGINDTIENVVLTKEFVKTLKNAVKYELLPYHPLGISKAEALGITQQKFEIPSKAKMEELRKYADISR